jgi:alkyl sulfatase BDS1-like metallo-beta-lactamase superfamily hydrolase
MPNETKILTVSSAQVTLRGAQVRDAKAWSGYLDEAISMFGGESDVVFGSHHWPTWGQDDLITRLSEQRDMFGYLHDQTVRMMNLGKHPMSRTYARKLTKQE